MLNSITPALSEIIALPNTLFLPLHGRHITQQNVNGITTGYPTILTLATNTAIGGQTVKLASVTPAAYNGYHKVLWASGASVAIDLDSSTLGAWSSGGTAAFNVAADATGINGPYDISGTITNIFSNPTDGITADASGTWIAPSTTDSIFELAGYTGKLLIAFDYNMAVATSGAEWVVGIGLVDAAGSNSKFGTLTVGCYGGQNPTLYYRPQVATDGTGTNTTCATAAMAATTKHCAWIVDFSEAAPVIRSYQDGIAKASATATMTNSTGHPSLTNTGRGILCGVTGGGLVSGKFGSASAVTAPRIQNLIWQKSDESISTLVNRVRTLASLKEYRA